MDSNRSRYGARNEDPDGKKYEERVLLIRRVTKKTTGGNYVTFSALVVVGDGNGKVGIGLGRSLEVPPAIQKAISIAKRSMITVPLYKSTIPHQVELKYKASKILLKPAPDGTGLKVGSVARSILELAGVKNASAKIIRSRNQIVNTYAVIEALKKLKPRIVKEDKKEEK
ncbi:30S ribosomal protein S5 [Candidatus Microgenomates bacterium]|nr:30S ribosomal protein S5 [Candidatus Microgenomates bacterium]